MYLFDSSDCHVYIYIYCVYVYLFNENSTSSCYPATGILFSDQTMGSLWHELLSWSRPRAWCDWVLGRQIGTIMIQEGTHMQHIPARLRCFAMVRSWSKLPKKTAQTNVLGNTWISFFQWEGVSLKKKRWVMWRLRETKLQFYWHHGWRILPRYLQFCSWHS